MTEAVTEAIKHLAAPVMQVKVAPVRRTKSQSTQVEISWQHMTYCVKRSRTLREFFGGGSGGGSGRFRTILNSVSGSIRSGQLVALMGPSGAGKSTLLECISGRRTIGVSGDIRFGGKDRLRVGFVEQFDHLLDHLTVKESLVFASRLRNAGKHYINHKNNADNLIKKLGLDVCALTLAFRCSGGQRKRLSIALELVSPVDVLILDEPTTGLDSSATSQTVKAMLSLTKGRKPIATVATIHQPSAKMFNMFSKVYVLSNNGVCVYDGPPQDVTRILSLIGLHIPQYYNPADFIIEVASGEYAKQSIHLLSHYNKESNRQKFDNMSSDGYTTVINAIAVEKSKRDKPALKQIWILMSRILIITYRDPNMFLLRVLTVFPTAFMIGWIFTSRVGRASGCPPSKLMLWDEDINELMAKFQDERYGLQENVALLFLSMMMCMFGTYSAIVLTFPFEMNVVLKEYSNAYYSIFAYYISKIVTDLPFCVLTNISLTGIVYYMTGQLFDSYYRPMYVILINTLVGLSGQTIGMFFGALFMENPNLAVFSSGIIILPLFIFAGFFRKLSLMPAYFLPISYVSFFRYSLTATLISVFGLKRCQYEHWLAESVMDVTNMTRPQWISSMSVLLQYQSQFAGASDKSTVVVDANGEPEDNLLIMFGGGKLANHTLTSLLLTQFDIDDSEDSLWHELNLLIFFVAVMYLLVYILLNWKVGRKR